MVLLLQDYIDQRHEGNAMDFATAWGLSYNNTRNRINSKYEWFVMNIEGTDMRIFRGYEKAPMYIDDHVVTHNIMRSTSGLSHRFLNMMISKEHKVDDVEEEIINRSIACRRHGHNSLVYVFEDRSSIYKDVVADQWFI